MILIATWLIIFFVLINRCMCPNRDCIETSHCRAYQACSFHEQNGPFSSWIAARTRRFVPMFSKKHWNHQCHYCYLCWWRWSYGKCPGNFQCLKEYSNLTLKQLFAYRSNMKIDKLIQNVLGSRSKFDIISYSVLLLLYCWF